MEEEEDGEYLPLADSDIDDEDMGSDYEDVDDEEAYLRGARPLTGIVVEAHLLWVLAYH